MSEQEPTMDSIEAELKQTLEGIGAGLEPDGDWMPVLLLYGGVEGSPGIVGLPTLGEHKDKMATIIIPHIVQLAKPKFASLITMGWAVEYDRSTIEGVAEQARDEAQFKPGEIEPRPSKYECLAAHIVDKDGHQRQLMAYVHRYPTSSPVLQWREDMKGEIPEGASGGRFPDALRESMEKAWKAK